MKQNVIGLKEDDDDDEEDEEEDEDDEVDEEPSKKRKLNEGINNKNKKPANDDKPPKLVPSDVIFFEVLFLSDFYKIIIPYIIILKDQASGSKKWRPNSIS